MSRAKLFAVIRTHGAAWQPSLLLECQQAWDAHAAFMNALHKEGFIVVGGPLEDTSDALLAIRAHSPDEIMARLADDPWTKLDLLRVTLIAPWQLRLGSLP